MDSMTRPLSIAVVGAGIAGRLLALELANRGCRVSLYDKDDPDGTNSCTHAGAGMLAPWCELDTASDHIFDLGIASLPLWQSWKDRLLGPLHLEFNGSLVTAHASDLAELERLRQHLLAGPHADGIRSINGAQLGELEPGLNGHFSDGLFFPGEGHVNNRDLLTSTTAALSAHATIDWQSGTQVDHITPGNITMGSTTHSFDWVADCRGLGAREDLDGLRGVRGELLYLHAPDVELHRPVRLMHPRHPIYIVPRADQLFVVGATSIESDDDRPITVRSALELLSAAYTLHSGFAEATVIEQISQRRPAFADNEPRIIHQSGLVHLNGLYRHGFLIAPALVELVSDLIIHGQQDPNHPALYSEATTCKSA